MKLFGSPDSCAYWCSMWFNCFIPSLWWVLDWMKDSYMLSTLNSRHKSYYKIRNVKLHISIFKMHTSAQCTYNVYVYEERKKQMDWISHHNDEFYMRYTLETVTSIPVTSILWILDTLWNRFGFFFQFSNHCNEPTSTSSFLHRINDEINFPKWLQTVTILRSPWLHWDNSQSILSLTILNQFIAAIALKGFLTYELTAAFIR